MNKKLDDLAKGMAQSVTRRQALKKFGVGLAGMALACLGFVNRASAKQSTDKKCAHICRHECGKNEGCYAACVANCSGGYVLG